MKFSDLFSSFRGTHSPTKRTVGIDIGSSSIKVVELEDREGVLTLTTYGETQLGPYDTKSVGEVATLSPDRERQAMVDVLRESAVKAKSAVLAMPLSASFVTVMSLQSAPDEDLGPRIRIEARKYIPAQIKDVTIDWAEIAVGQAVTDHRDVLVAAIQNDALRRLNSLTEFINFIKPPSEIECFSVIRALSGSNAESVAIIDIGAMSAKLYIVRNGLLQRMHRVRAGGAICTKRISEVLEISFAEAEYKKRNITKSDARYRDVQRAHQSSYEQAFKEFKQVINGYEQTMGTTIAVVYASGGAVVFPDFITQAKDVLRKDVIMVTPFSKVAYPAFMEDLLREIGPSFAVALGAALRMYE